MRNFYEKCSKVPLINKNCRFRTNIYKNRAVTPYLLLYQSIAHIDAQHLLTIQQHLKLMTIRPENVFTIGLCTLFWSKIATTTISKIHALSPIFIRNY